MAPSNAGEILDQTIALTKSHLWLLTKVVLPPLLLVGIALGLAPSQDDPNGGPWILLPFLVFMVVGPFYWLAAIHTAAECYVGRPVTALAAYRHALRVWLRAFWTAILYVFGVWAVNFVIVLPLMLAAGAAMLGLGSVGVVVFVVSYIAMLVVQWILNLYFVMAICVVAVEKTNGFAALHAQLSPDERKSSIGHVAGGDRSSPLLRGPRHTAIAPAGFDAGGRPACCRESGEQFCRGGRRGLLFCVPRKTEHFDLVMLADGVGVNEEGVGPEALPGPAG